MTNTMNPNTQKKEIYSIQDLLILCKQDMAQNGLDPREELVLDGKVKRFSADDNPLKKDEWYIGTAEIGLRDFPIVICTYGSWSSGQKYTFNSFDVISKSDYGLNKEEMREGFKRLKELTEAADREGKIQLAAQHGKAAQEVAAIYASAVCEPSDNEYTRYIRAKKISIKGEVPYPIKFTTYFNQAYPCKAMMIPWVNIDGTIRSAQYIYCEGTRCTKRWHSGAEKKSNFYPFKHFGDAAVVYVAEGYATAASIFEALHEKEVVIMAGDAGNIIAVVESIRSIQPHIEIIIAADNDEAGLSKAEYACSLYNCSYIKPNDFKDFNDMACELGIEAVRVYIEKEVSRLKSETPGGKINMISTTLSHETQKSMADLFNWNVTTPAAGFSLECFPDPLRNYIEDICKNSAAVDIITTMSLLSTLSAFIGTTAQHPLSAGTSLYSNFYALCITESANFKSTSLSLGAEFMRKRRQFIVESEKEIKQSYAKESEQESRLADLWRLDIQMPGSGSWAALVDQLSKRDAGVIHSSEFGAFMANSGQKHNSAQVKELADLYDCPFYYTSVTKKDGVLHITQPFLSIVGVSTPSWIQSAVKSEDLTGGFWPRFLLFVTPSSENERTYYINSDGNFNISYSEAIESIIKDIGNKSLCLVAGTHARALIQKIFEEIHNHLDDSKSHELLAAYPRRWCGAILKLAMIFELFNTTDPQEISVQSILAAWSIVRFAVDSTIKLFNECFLKSEFDQNLEYIYNKIVELYLKTNIPVRRSDISNTCKRKFKDKKELTAYLETLEDQERIVKDTQTKKGERYQPF